MKVANSSNKIIQAVNAPLGFFVLALLIVESFLGLVLVKSDLPDKTAGMHLGIGMFIVVVFCVMLLVWFKPQHLIFDKQAHLDYQKFLKEAEPVIVKSIQETVPKERDVKWYDDPKILRKAYEEELDFSAGAVLQLSRALYSLPRQTRMVIINEMENEKLKKIMSSVADGIENEFGDNIILAASHYGTANPMKY